MTIQEARWVRPDTPVVGVFLGGEARAYPVHVMEYHQVVNDVIGGVPVAVTYDPLTDAAVAYRRVLPGASGAEPGETPGGTKSSGPVEFGVSGLVFESGLLLYDRRSDSLWSQFTGKALAGPRAGEQLERMAARIETMRAWIARHPESRVMTLPERERFDYRLSNFAAYWTSEKVLFPVTARDDRFHPKELVLGARVGDLERAYVGSILTRAGARVVDDLAGQKIRIEYDGESGTFVYQAPEGVEVTTAYWFAWKAFHPDTEIWNERAISP